MMGSRGMISSPHGWKLIGTTFSKGELRFFCDKKQPMLNWTCKAQARPIRLVSSLHERTAHLRLQVPKQTDDSIRQNHLHLQELKSAQLPSILDHAFPGTMETGGLGEHLKVQLF